MNERLAIMFLKLILGLISLCQCCLLSGVVWAVTVDGVAHGNEASSQPINILLIFGLAVSIWGLYCSRKQKIVVFANLTDIIATVVIPVIGALFMFLAYFLEMKGALARLFIAAPSVCALCLVIKGTYAYNASIHAGFIGFILSLFTKLFLLALYIFILLFIFLGSTKRKGENENAYRRRIRRENSTHFMAATAIFGLLAYLGLWDKNVVSLREYINGDWGSQEKV